MIPMLDEKNKQILKDLSPEKLGDCFKELRDILQKKEDFTFDKNVSDWKHYPLMKVIFCDFPNRIYLGSSLKLNITEEVDSFLRVNNSDLRNFIGTELGAGDIGKAKRLLRILDCLKDLSEEKKYTKNWVPRSLPTSISEGLADLMRPWRKVPNPIKKNTNLGEFISNILKDVKNFHPNVYEEYGKFKKGVDVKSFLMRSVHKTLSYQYYSGTSESFCPMFFFDIINSPQFQAMSVHPKYQLILLDMIVRANFLSGTLKDQSVETNGFIYTWSDCNIEIAESTFQEALKDIVNRGWFKVIGFRKLIDGRYVKKYIPSIKWKTINISDEEVSRIQKYKLDKLNRIERSKARNIESSHTV